MRVRAFLIGLLATAGLLLAQLPEPYKKVDHVMWVVKDLDAVTAGWQRAGMPNMSQSYVQEMPGARYQGKVVNTRLRSANAVVGDVVIHWISPEDDNNPFAAYLKSHGEGVFSLVHDFATAEALRAELARLNRAGIPTLFEGSFPAGDSTVTFAFMDTVKEGKYSLGLVAGRPVVERPVHPDRRITQFAFIANPLEPVSAFWQKAGFPAMSYTEGKLTDTAYREKPAQWEARLGWQRHGKVVYEWIEHRQGESTYKDHMQKYGEGFHHFGMNVADMDRSIAEWKALGFPVSMSGGWGEKGKKGSGRFTYLDTRPLGGIEVELLWNYREGQ